ncbi:HNH endonuclease [Heyndrickxia camelliae]|uniref:HNH endonuclease n=1 Tax=Heyndrickxia camelliae TaxID=1707093 RepID=A0A2N3LNK0_9BACI|nr:HNH endonuclease signature motif containing protein [Heyndrickxia camelliae]PKR86119.1 HNH endonuclease [Heyndrickxia camelliae]
MIGFHPYSKEQQLRREKKPKKKRKNPLKPEVYKGRVIPKKQVRGRILRKEYNKAAERHGYECYVCGTTQALECHHVRFRANGGRGTHRNLIFLCGNHHRGKYSPHQHEGLRKDLEALHESKYGPYYYCDKYDLFKAGIIENTSDECFEKFMREEEERCLKLGQTLNG